MFEFLEQMSGMEYMYVIMMVAGGTIFFIRLFLMFFTGIDADPSDAETSIADSSETALRYISLQSISSFGLIGGLFGFWAERTFHNSVISVLITLAAGAVMVLIMARLTAFMLKLQNRGNIKISNSVGKDGKVYLTLQKDGTGQVEFSMQGRRLYYSAVSENGEVIPTGTRVRIVRVTDDSVLVVVPLTADGAEEKGTPAGGR